MWPASSLASLPHPDTALTKQVDGFIGAVSNRPLDSWAGPGHDVEAGGRLEVSQGDAQRVLSLPRLYLFNRDLVTSPVC